jgi:hypothetical protein
MRDANNTGGAMSDQIEPNTVLDGWAIERRRSHYSPSYWITFVLAAFGQTVPTPPRITYTLRQNGTGKIRTVTLPGDHKKSDLAEAIAAANTGPTDAIQVQR